MQTKYLIGIALLTSIVLSSLAGFSLAYFSCQPQINNLNTKVSNLQGQLNSNVTTLTDKIGAVQAYVSALQLQNANLNASVNALRSYVDNISLVSGSSYYVFKQNNTYYAQNGVDGTIEYHSENCSSVIDYAFANVPFGGEVLLKPLASDADAYYVFSAICPPNGTTLASENRVVTICLENDINADVIDLHNVHDVHIENINIYGNRWNGTAGDGITISSDTNTGTNDLIENVVIDDCNGTGIWVQNNALNNAFGNVEVFHSAAYNVQVDSADNQFIDVESGWAGLSGFSIMGVENYFVNCVSWGCGGAQSQSDRNGFYIEGARNTFVECEADRNDMGGFVIANAKQTSLTSCIAVDNGQQVSGCWGFDLYNSIGTVMSTCLSTDEQANKTQDYGFTEGGSSDYNIVTGCNFDGNRVGAVFDLVGLHSAITDTLGYETENFGLSNFSVYDTVAVGTNGTFEEATNFTSSKEAITDFHVTIKWDNVSSNENVTVKVQALMANGTTTSFETSRNDNGTYTLNEEDLSGLWSGWSTSNPIEALQISAETTENEPQASVSAFVWGSGN